MPRRARVALSGDGRASDLARRATAPSATAACVARRVHAYVCSPGATPLPCISEHLDFVRMTLRSRRGSLPRAPQDMGRTGRKHEDA
eukprot:364283-Chlamydomonas_euryale.AAC.8